MSRPLIYVDTSEVRDGALTEVKTAIGELARHVERASPQVLAYDAFFSADGNRMTVVHLHADAESLDQFTQLAGPRFARFRDLLTLRSIDVYDQPAPPHCTVSNKRRGCSATATSRYTRRTPASAASDTSGTPPHIAAGSVATDRAKDLCSASFGGRRITLLSSDPAQLVGIRRVPA
jgi:hypothetical protein